MSKKEYIVNDSQEYIVSLNKNVDYAAFNQEMIASVGCSTVPCRCVDVVDPRPGSQRNTHYMLTDTEAQALRNDPRVYGVTLLPELDPSVGIGVRAIQSGDFTKTTQDRGDFLNWGMRRINEATNPYSGATVVGGYNFTLDGTGVDVVIMDSGIQVDHPEFQDASGVSRVQQINWATASGLSFTQNANHYRDFDGHGTHVAGTVAGKTYGWAKNAKIYAVKLAGLEGPSDSGTGISVANAFDCIKLWHAAKPIDPATGYKRPTVVNMSWGYLRSYNTVVNLTYRGVLKTGVDIDSAAKRWAFGLPPTSDASGGFTYSTNLRVPSVDTDLQELIDAGVHVCISAGNLSHKIDVVGGDDFGNFIAADTGSNEYQKGSSPYDEEAYIVGNIDSVAHVGGLEQKAASSETGPGVDIYAPGTDIMSAMSTTNAYGANTVDNPYPANAAFLINNISGTSMASPQVAGVLALWLQINPEATPAQGLAFINYTAKTAQIYETGSAVDYTDTRSLLGGENRFAFNKFNSSVQLRIGSTVQQPAIPTAATYVLSTSSASVNEGSSFTITLTTTNVANGTAVPYIITGVSSADIDGASLTGNFVVNNNTAVLIVNVTADSTTEGTEIFTLTLDFLSVSQSVTINDTSTAPVVPTYAATPAANNVDEGSDLTIDVATTNVNNGTTLYWTVSNAGDFTTSSGSFPINSGAGSFTVTPAADAITEGPETFSVSIRTGSAGGTVVATTSSITINDTSTTPAGTVYNVTVASGTNEYGLGNKYYIDGFGGPSPTLNLIEGNTYTFRQSDSSNTTHPLRFSATANGTWGGGVPYTNGVTIVGTAGQLGAYTQITVAVGAPTLYYYCVNHSGMGGTANTPSAATPTYDSVTSPASANEGDTVTFTVDTQNVDNGTTVGYTITGIDVNDLSAGSLTGNITINSNTGTVGVTLANDETTEGAETMTLTLAATDSAGTSTGALSSSTIVNDTSTTPVIPTYTVTPAASSVDEGSALTFNVTATDVVDGTTLYWTVTNAGDFATSSGSFTVTSNAGTFSVTPTADLTTEGAETFTASIRTGSTSGPIVATSSTVTINDTSTTPVVATYAVVASTSSVNEGQSVTFNVSTTNVDDNTTLYWSTNTVSGTINASDFTDNLVSGSFTINNNTGSIVRGIRADTATEGSESFTLSIRTVSTSGTVRATSGTVTINDTSTAPAFVPDYTITVTNSGNNYLLTGSDRNGSFTNVSQPTLAFNSGDLVRFNVNSGTSSGHPFFIKTSQSTGTGNQVSGVTGQGTTQLDWTTATAGAGSYGYQCSIHFGMWRTITISAPAFVPDYTIGVANSGNNYLLTGSDRNGSFSSSSQPTLAFNNGDRVRFNVNAGTSSAHPFFIKTSQSTGTGNQVSGVIGQGTTQLDWTTATAGAGTRGYQCSIHFGMWRTITIS